MAQQSSQSHEQSHGQSHHHIIPFHVYVKVCVALMVLTFLTVGYHVIAHSRPETFGLLAAPVAFIIATVKAALVLMYFMHLKYDSSINRIIFASAFCFVFLLFILTAIDIYTRVQVVSPF